ncbi:MAG: hypothetical protein AB8C13_10895, partial [Phycisphaerales bacterium]
SAKSILLLTALATLAMGSQALASDTTFTYQGTLSESGSPLDGTADVDVSLWDSEVAGTQIGSTTNLISVAVTEGLFALNLDFGGAAFDGDRWIELSINGTTLSPRQRVNASPYAIQTRGMFVDDAGQVAIGHNAPTSLLHLRGGDATLQADTTDLGQSIFFQRPDGNILTRLRVVQGNSTFNTDFRISQGDTSNPGSLIDQIIIRDRVEDDLTRIGIGDHVPSAHLDVRSNGITQQTIRAVHSASEGSAITIQAENAAVNGTAIYGYAEGTVATSTGVYGEAQSSSGRGVYGRNTAPFGPAYGVFGESTGNFGTGVIGVTNSGTGTGYGVYGSSANANPSNYGVFSNGNLGSSGFKTFRIDHPLDPANKYLQHYSSEGPEPINEYSGNVYLDETGGAWVTLPAYFETINTDFRYDLTPIGASAPGLYIAQEVQSNTFRIEGGKPGLKVSWEVKARRFDPYARTYSTQAVVEKQGREVGRYLQPQLFGEPMSKSMNAIQAEAPQRINADD